MKYRLSAVSTVASPQEKYEIESVASVSSFEMENYCLSYSDRCHCELGSSCPLPHDEECSKSVRTNYEILRNYPELIVSMPKRSKSLFY